MEAEVVPEEEVLTEDMVEAVGQPPTHMILYVLLRLEVTGAQVQQVVVVVVVRVFTPILAV